MNRRPLRSALFAPGNQPRKVEKVATFGADAVILDLEDAVPLAEKQATRPVVRQAVSTYQAGPGRYIRVNAIETGLTRDDIAGVVSEHLDGIVLPKVESADDLRQATEWLDQAEAAQGVPSGRIELLPLIETARGVLDARDIAAASPRVVRLGFGGADFCRDVGVRFTGTLWEPDGLELMYARSQIVLASRVAGLEPPFDTVWLDVRDNIGLEQDARVALRLGFGGKAAIYPGQIPVIHRVFSPSDEELDFARRVVAAFEQAEAANSAAIQVDGRLVDYPIAEKARWLLERAGASRP